MVSTITEVSHYFCFKETLIFLCRFFLLNILLIDWLFNFADKSWLFFRVIFERIHVFEIWDLFWMPKFVYILCRILHYSSNCCLGYLYHVLTSYSCTVSRCIRSNESEILLIFEHPSNILSISKFACHNNILYLYDLPCFLVLCGIFYF